MTSPTPDMTPFLTSLFLAWSQQGLSPAQPTWSLSSIPHTSRATARAQIRVLILSAQDPHGLLAASRCHLTLRAVNSPQARLPSGLTPPSRHSLRPTPTGCLPLSGPCDMAPPCPSKPLYCTPSAPSLLASLWPLHSPCSSLHLSLHC